MHSYILTVISVLILTNTYSQDNQSLNGLIKTYIENEKANKTYNYSELIKRINKFPTDKILKKITNYQSDDYKEVRNAVFKLAYDLARNEKDTFKQKVYVEKLIEGNYFVVGIENWSEKFKYFKKNGFSEKAKKNYIRFIKKEFNDKELRNYTRFVSAENKKSIIHSYQNYYKQQNIDKKKTRKDLDSIGKAEDNRIKQSILKRLPNKDEILIIGFLELTELIPYLEDLILDEKIKNLNLKWAAHLALARLGKDYELNYCMNLIKKPPVSDKVIYSLVPDLVYLRHSEAIDYMVEILNSNEKNCISANPESNEPILCGYRIMEHLAPIIENYPLKVSTSGDIESGNYEAALLTARQWFKNQNSNYKIIKDNF